MQHGALLRRRRNVVVDRTERRVGVDTAQVRQQSAGPGSGVARRRISESRRHDRLKVLRVVGDGHKNLPLVGQTLRRAHRFARFFHRRQQQRDQHDDDRDDHQQLDQRETAGPQSETLQRPELIRLAPYG